VRSVTSLLKKGYTVIHVYLKISEQIGIDIGTKNMMDFDIDLTKYNDFAIDHNHLISSVYKSNVSNVTIKFN